MNFGQRTAESGQRTFKAFCLLSAVCCLLSLNAQEAPPPKDSDLVAAAKKAKAGRVTIPRKVITNADVKKAKGKLIELPASGAKLMAAAPQQNTVEQHQAQMKTAAAAERVHAEATKKVADLEKELAAIEQSYYEENDPAYRDDVIKKKFEQKKTELDAARAALNK